MSLESRTSNALFKRKEQLKRWEDSETNKVPSELASDKPRRIKFSDGCVFLAACAASDKTEVERLLSQGADINTANVDGLTALHQACIDDNFEMVEFLVHHDCDLNCGDNEGWTPLHATASCGFVSIARYLLEHGANVAAVNNDGDLPIDIAESDQMEELLQAEIDRQGVNCESARNEEERIMLEDAKQMLNNQKVPDKVHLKTGATSLHVAAAKGYLNVMNILIQAGANLNSQDNDGWTPLHAASHWGQKESCKLLAENLCNMDIQNFVGQTCFDVADVECMKLLEELKKKQASMQREKPEIKEILERKAPPPLKRRTSVTRMSGADKSSVVTKDTSFERAQIEANLRLQEEEEEDKERKVEDKDLRQRNLKEEEEVARRNEVNKAADKVILTIKEEPVLEPESPSLSKPALESQNSIEDEVPPWRRGARRPPSVTPPLTLEPQVAKPEEESTEISAVIIPKKPSNEEIVNESANGPSEVELRPKLQIDTNLVSSEDSNSSTPVDTPTQGQFKRTFAPPVRDEESETQRKAHAKRVRETRRSTQGVTLEDLKSAEQQLLRKQQEEDEKREREKEKDKPKDPNVTGSTTTELERRLSWRRRAEGQTDNQPVLRTVPSSPDTQTVIIAAPARCRPVSAPTPITSNKVTSSPEQTVTVSLRSRSQPDDDKEGGDQDRDDSRSAQGTQAAIQRRRRPKRRSTGVVYLDGEPNQENQANQEQDTREEEIQDPARDTRNTTERVRSRFGSSGSLPESVKSEVFSESGSRQNDRLGGSTSSLAGDEEILDYKKLYEELKEENEALKDKLSKTEDELFNTKRQLDKSLQNNVRNSLSDTEKRERRALERKISELEEELKQLDQVKQLKADNQRLRDENGALIRVISKLSK